MLKKMISFAAVAGLVLALAGTAQAATIKVDIGPSSQDPGDVQAGFEAWNIDTGFNTTLHSKGFTLGTDGFTASLQANGASLADGTGGATANNTQSGDAGPLGDLATDSWFARRDTVFTLSGLDAGPYNLTTYHRGQTGPITYTLTDSVAPDETGSLTQLDATDTDGTLGIGSFTFVSDGSDVILRLNANQAVTGNNHNAYLNGFELELVPEPATMALLAFGGIGLLVRRRRRK